VYLENGSDKKFDSPKEHAIMDQKNLVFIPHVLPIVVGATVDFPNSDTVRHNVFSPKGSAKVFNLGTYDVGVVKEVKFDEPGVVPLLCNVHSEMSAYIIVCKTPYFSLTDRKGDFIIKNVSPGKYKITVWHEKLRPQSQEITVEASKEIQVEFSKLVRK